MVENELGNAVFETEGKKSFAVDSLDLNHSLPQCNHKLLEYVCAAFIFLVSSLVSEVILFYLSSCICS